MDNTGLSSLEVRMGMFLNENGKIIELPPFQLEVNKDDFEQNEGAMYSQVEVGDYLYFVEKIPLEARDQLPLLAETHPASTPHQLS